MNESNRDAEEREREREREREKSEKLFKKHADFKLGEAARPH